MLLHPNISVGVSVGTSAVQEMLAFDDLGPRTRDALQRSPIKFSAAEILSGLLAGGFDPTFSQVDKAMAKIVDFAAAFKARRELK